MFKKSRKENLNQADSAHRQSMIESLQHRLEVARAKGDQNLVRQLEAEASYLNVK